MLYSAGYDDTIRCWKHEGSIDDWICSAVLNGHKSTVWQFDFSPCGEYIVSCSQDKSIIVWHQNKPIITKENTHERAIFSVSWSGDKIASAGSDN